MAGLRHQFTIDFYQSFLYHFGCVSSCANPGMCNEFIEWHQAGTLHFHIRLLSWNPSLTAYGFCLFTSFLIKIFFPFLFPFSFFLLELLLDRGVALLLREFAEVVRLSFAG